MPMELAKPERNGSIIVMTSDDTPVIGQAFWHEHGDGTWALHWSPVSPKEDCWNDPITETNKGLACWQPMPEGPCEARVKAMGSPGPHMAALLRVKELEEAVDTLTARAEASEQREAGLREALRRVKEISNPTVRIERPRLHLDRAWEIADAALTTKSGEASQ